MNLYFSNSPFPEPPDDSNEEQLLLNFLSNAKYCTFTPGKIAVFGKVRSQTTCIRAISACIA